MYHGGKEALSEHKFTILLFRIFFVSGVLLGEIIREKLVNESRKKKEKREYLLPFYLFFLITCFQLLH